MCKYIHNILASYIILVVHLLLYLLTAGFDEWRNQMKVYMINYSALKIEEIIAKGLATSLLYGTAQFKL